VTAKPSLPSFALFDNNLDPGTAGGAWLLRDLRTTLTCRPGGDWQGILRELEQASRNGAWVALAASYELGCLIEPRLRPLLRNDEQSLLTGWIFERGEWLDDAACEAWLESRASQATGGIGALRSGISESSYLAHIARIQQYIAAGDCYQVNYTFPLEGELFGDPVRLYQALRRAQPVRYGAFIQHANGCILSRSPELFLERQGSRLSSQPMKGTAPRDSDPALLAASAKDKAENIMIVDLIRNDMGRLAQPGGVRVEDLFRIDPYPTVWQMTSRVVAEPVEADLAAVFGALFPCGSITGAPKIRAMEIIHELEQQARGLYCGALGWLRPGGDFRFSVPIRTVLADSQGHARLNLGSGVVYDSVAEAEWDECHLKGRFLTALPKGLRLIETLRYEPGETPFPFLAEHLERLSSSADWFAYPCDEQAVRQVLAGVGGDTPLRVRLTLGQAGDLQLETAALSHGAPGPDPTIVLSPLHTDSRDPLYRHKTTARQLYDRELARVMAAGHFDAVFVNEKGELTEGARSNIFVEKAGAWLTPPVEAGVLDGVLRRRLIREGRARVARLTAADLQQADAIYMGNGLRGLVRVSLTTAWA